MTKRSKRSQEPFAVTPRRHQCPGCGRDNDALGGPGSPRPGDFVLCIACAVYQVVTADGGVRLMTNREWLALSPDERQMLSGQRDRLKTIMTEFPLPPESE